MGKGKTTGRRSKCCGATVRFIGKVNIKTVCNKCHKDCDYYTVERNLWVRNPKTQVAPDDREKIKKQLTDKDIKEIRSQEDF